MHYKQGTRILPQAKSYTNIYDIFGSMPFSNILYRNPKTGKEDLSFQATCGDFAAQNSQIFKMLNVTPFITSEKYNCLNKTSMSKSVVHSTSTIFYDLDDIAKRHSFHCITELSTSTIRVIKKSDVPNNIKHSRKGFAGKSNAIVQECATQIQPVLLPLDSREINTKKIKKKFPNDAMLSSEIFLRDNDYVDIYQKNQYIDNDTNGRQQKFWSYAKYRTEYTNPITEDKKSKKKDHSKRIEDPCPCQLFSYSCPCTDKKSLTELAKRSKSKTVTDQITSTTKMIPEQVKTKIKKLKHDSTKYSNKTDKTVVQKTDNVIEDTATITEPVIIPVTDDDVPKVTDKNQNANFAKNTTKPQTKTRRIICPNCKEKVEIVSVTDEEVTNRNESIIYRSKEILRTAYAYRTSGHNVKAVDEDEVCCHEPRCEMIPICQILPNDNIYLNPKCVKSKAGSKGTPRVIRITKACRHHPPCTVVPSCQRANVLKNNCEFIPPCLHRPRCVNLPLCAPFIKNLHCDDPTNALHVHDMESPEYTGCNYIHLCQHDSLENNLNQQYNMVHVQNPRELLHPYHSPPYMVNREPPYVPTCYSPCHMSQSPFSFCKSNKSCQYTCLSNSNPKNVRESSSDAVIFIRDVGCQFRNKNHSPHSVVGSKVPSASFEFLDTKLVNYYTNIHTLRYEDKFTHPITKVECSNTSTVSNTSFDSNSNCPSHGCHRRHGDRQSGFRPKPNTSPYIAAFSTYTDELSIDAGSNNSISEGSINYNVINSIQELIQNRGYYNTFNVKSRRNLKNKHKKTLSPKRRRKSKANSQLGFRFSRKDVYNQGS